MGNHSSEKAKLSTSTKRFGTKQISHWLLCVCCRGFQGVLLLILFLLSFFLTLQQHYLDRLGLCGCKVAEASSRQNKGRSASRSFPCWLTLLAPDNGNVKSELPLGDSHSSAPCSVLFLNLPVWGFPALWVGWVQEGVIRCWWSWWWPGSRFPAPCGLLLLSRVQRVWALGRWGKHWSPSSLPIPPLHCVNSKD